jgi:hypothetical protein
MPTRPETLEAHTQHRAVVQLAPTDRQVLRWPFDVQPRTTAPHAGLTYQGHHDEHPAAAECCTEVGADDEREPMSSTDLAWMVFGYGMSVALVCAAAWFVWWRYYA